ncbi:MAG: hypothetical protein ACKOI2_13655 [Actinomycetota bacterium]
MNTNINSFEGSGEDSEVRGSKRTSRRVGAGIAAGLVAAIGLGLAIQSPISAAQVSDSPSGAQLPWGDSDDVDGSIDGSTDDMSLRRDPMHNGNRHEDPNGRPGGHRDGHRDGQRGGLRDGGARDGERMGGPRELLALAAKTLGITPEELMTELKAGKSVADVASERDVPVQDVIDALVDEVVSNATERITELVNRKPQTPGSDTPES